MNTPEFNSESFGFFRELAQHNNKSWFDQNRERYEGHILAPFRALLVALEPSLLKLNPNFETAGKTNRNFSRINRDIRFSKDKSPYKSNYYLYCFDRRRDRDKDGRLYVGLSADCVTIGFATYASWKRGVKSALETTFRKRVITHRQSFNRLLGNVVRASRYETYWHREEEGEWAQHPGLPRKDEDWQTLQAWIVRKVLLPSSRLLRAPAFGREVEMIFKNLYPLYAFTSLPAREWEAQVKKRP